MFKIKLMKKKFYQNFGIKEEMIFFSFMVNLHTWPRAIEQDSSGLENSKPVQNLGKSSSGRAGAYQVKTEQNGAHIHGESEKAPEITFNRRARFFRSVRRSVTRVNTTPQNPAPLNSRASFSEQSFWIFFWLTRTRKTMNQSNSA